jgi:hypothetical protein
MQVNPKDWAVTASDDESLTVQHKTTGHVKVLAIRSSDAALFGRPARAKAEAAPGAPEPETAAQDLGAAEQRGGGQKGKGAK